MCEASENEVDVNQHPSLTTKDIEAKDSCPSDGIVSNNENHANDFEESSHSKDKLDDPSEDQRSHPTRPIVSDSNNIESIENNQKAIQENGLNKTTQSNGIDNEKTSEIASNEESNGHSNGNYVNDDHNRDITENHSGLGK